MTPQERKQLFRAFERVLNLDPKETHNDLVGIYARGIGYIKNKYSDRTREEKSSAMYWVRLNYLKNGLNMPVTEKLINDYFTIYDKEFENFKNSFELITDEDYLLLSFAYRNL